jgi:DNA polymerase-3 subunit beta
MPYEERRTRSPLPIPILSFHHPFPPHSLRGHAMRVRAPTPALLDAVGHAAAVAAAKSPKPVLECVVLRASRGTGLSLEATDLDVGLRLHVPEATVEEEGALAVQAARLLAVVREVGDPETPLVERDGVLAVESGRSRFRIRTEALDEFPELPYLGEGSTHQVPGGLLRGMIRRTVFATAKEAGRFALHGVLFRVAGDQLELVATDGRRLAKATGVLERRSDREVRVIVGPKGLSLLERVMGAEPGDVSLAVQERQVLLRVGEALVVSRLIDGTFPSYEDVIPKAAAHAFQVPVADFSTALRRASLLTTRDAVSVQFDVAPGLLTVRSRAVEVGEAEAEVSVAYDGPSERLGFNPVFLLDALKVMDPAKSVRFEFTSGKAPGKLTDGDDFVYVVMPIALE